MDVGVNGRDIDKKGNAWEPSKEMLYMLIIDKFVLSLGIHIITKVYSMICG